jgi:hypothetical protein
MLISATYALYYTYTQVDEESCSESTVERKSLCRRSSQRLFSPLFSHLSLQAIPNSE